MAKITKTIPDTITCNLLLPQKHEIDFGVEGTLRLKINHLNGIPYIMLQIGGPKTTGKHIFVNIAEFELLTN